VCYCSNVLLLNNCGVNESLPRLSYISYRLPWYCLNKHGGQFSIRLSISGGNLIKRKENEPNRCDQAQININSDNNMITQWLLFDSSQTIISYVFTLNTFILLVLSANVVVTIADSRGIWTVRNNYRKIISNSVNHITQIYWYVMILIHLLIYFFILIHLHFNTFFSHFSLTLAGNNLERNLEVLGVLLQTKKPGTDRVHIRGGGFENHKKLVPVFFDTVAPLYFCAIVYPQMSVAEQKSHSR
jgi:hypothetical protein